MQKIYEIYTGEWDKRGNPIPEITPAEPQDNLKMWEDLCDSCGKAFHVKHILGGLCSDCQDDFKELYGDLKYTTVVICVNTSNQQRLYDIAKEVYE